MKKSKRGGMWWDQMGWAIIAIAILIIVLLGVFLLRNQGVDLLEKLKEIFRFGR